MQTPRSLALLAIPAAALLFACSKRAPPSPAVVMQDAAAPELPPAERARVLSEVEKELEAYYVFPDVGAKMAALLRDRAARGDYDGLTTAEELARVVTDDMRSISHDRHAALERAFSPEVASAERRKFEQQEAEDRASAGLGPTTRMPGNVAHLVLRAFEPLDGARDALAARLSELADADALILDLRDNYGGDPATVAFVASYVFGPEPVHLNDMYWRTDDSTQSFFTLRDVPGRRFDPKKPLFVLTSKDTFSAAEELAYDVQCARRATVVGETTKGGAHPVKRRELSPLFVLRTPTGRAINPITRTNWEGTGVTPDVPVAAEDALREAHARALAAIAASAGDRRR